LDSPIAARRRERPARRKLRIFSRKSSETTNRTSDAPSAASSLVPSSKAYVNAPDRIFTDAEFTSKFTTTCFS
ncbi:MAG TPA: hypothetical protein VK561_03195, partial [Bradyrhizobium sp.]|nr:hypothetical protein [Bradyrhizobium sp.]